MSDLDRSTVSGFGEIETSTKYLDSWLLLNSFLPSKQLKSRWDKRDSAAFGLSGGHRLSEENREIVNNIYESDRLRLSYFEMPFPGELGIILLSS